MSCYCKRKDLAGYLFETSLCNCVSSKLDAYLDYLSVISMTYYLEIKGNFLMFLYDLHGIIVGVIQYFSVSVVIFHTKNGLYRNACNPPPKLFILQLFP